MRIVPAIFLIVLAAFPAWAQEYAAQDYPQATTPQQQVSGNYVGQPYYAPAQPQYQPQVQPVQPPAPASSQPGDYGRSVMTDIRQMNF